MGRHLKLLLSGVCIIFSLVGCTQETTNYAAKDQRLREVIDASGCAVKLPSAKDIQRIVIVSPPIFTMTEALIDDPNRIVGIHPLARLNANTDLLDLKIPHLTDLDDTYVNGFKIDIEKLLNLKPDIVFYHGTQQKKELEALNIPVVNFYQENETDISAVVKDWERIICTVLDISPKLSIKEEIEKVEALKESMGEEKEKKKALLLFNNSGEKITVSGQNTYGSYWIDFAGMENVAYKIEGQKEVSMEQIYQWQPDIIYLFMGPNADQYKLGIHNQDWTRVNAVKNEEIYDVPVGLFSWSAPCVDTPLMLKWLLIDDKKGDAFKTEIKEYYKRCYGLELADELVEKILQPQKGAIVK